MSNHDMLRVITRQMRARYQAGETISNEEVRVGAVQGGVSVRHLRRLVSRDLETHLPVREPAWRPSREVIDLYTACNGNATATVAACTERGIPTPGVRAVQKAVNRFVGSTTVASARYGEDGLHLTALAVPRGFDHRNACWALDHTVAPIGVQPLTPGGDVWQPWVTTMRDEHTGLFLVGFASEDQPNSDDSMSTLALGVEGLLLPDGSRAGGIPEIVLSDRGGDFLTKAANLGLVGLDVERRVTMPYSPRGNGGAERLQGVWQQMYVSRWPGHTKGARDSYQRKKQMRSLDPSTLMTFEQFAARFLAMMDRYNTVHRPKRLGGLTPAEAYAADPTPLRWAEPEVVRLALMTVEEDRTVQRQGIEFRTAWYSDDVLAGLDVVGQRVQVRARRHDPRFVEVFQQGVHLGRVGLADAQTQETRARMVVAASEQKSRAAEHLVQGDLVNAIENREELRRLGFPEDSLPALPGEEAADAPTEAKRPTGQGRRRVPMKKTARVAPSTTEAEAAAADELSAALRAARRTA